VGLSLSIAFHPSLIFVGWAGLGGALMNRFLQMFD
jgi:hypothetical protein